MTDQIFYEELRATIRDAIASYLDTYTDEELRELATESLNLPPHPTLADMTEEERRDCQWMQADVEEGADPCVLFVIGTRSAKGVAKTGLVTVGPHECFTPRPDLPRLEWPDYPGFYQ